MYIKVSVRHYVSYHFVLMLKLNSARQFRRDFRPATTKVDIILLIILLHQLTNITKLKS